MDKKLYYSWLDWLSQVTLCEKRDMTLMIIARSYPTSCGPSRSGMRRLARNALSTVTVILLFLSRS